jgi:hypothetical protein
VALRGPVQRWEAQVDGARVTVACVGRPTRFRRPLRQWFGVPALPAAVEPARALHDPAALRGVEGDLVMAAIHPWAADRFRRDGWQIMPEAVRWSAPRGAVPPARPSESLRSDLRKLARGGWTDGEGRGDADWAEFFGRMMEPHARTRFGAEVWLPNAHLRARFRRAGRLHFVQRDGERVAGFVTLAHGGVLWCPVLGVRDDRPGLQRDGVMTAVYDGIARLWHASGCGTLDLGRTSPFLSDGVARVKRKWGFSPVRDRLAQLVAVRADPACAPLAQALAREPVLVLDEHGAPAPWHTAARSPVP